MKLAIDEARKYVGATSPNPPVGAVLADSEGNILSVGAHQKAGLDHAEIIAIKSAGANLEKAHTLYVTLEPCNHTGRTGPCTEAILQTPIKRVVYGIADPNPEVVGSGASYLKLKGIEVIDGVLAPECRKLTEGFLKLKLNKRPFITIKRAFNENSSMVPEAGQKTFTSQESLTFAHELRKESDAIITGSGTVLTDNPLFNVRYVPDHPGKRRLLIVLDRRRQVRPSWIKEASLRGLDVRIADSLESAVAFATAARCLKVLVEAGARVSEAFLKSPYWDRHIEIFKANPDRIVITDREG